jgi:hypothetical protein
MFPVVFAVVVSVLIAAYCAAAAAEKGRSPFGFFLFGLLAWPIALITVLIIAPLDRPKTLAEVAMGDRKTNQNEMATCAACSAATPAALSFCTSCRTPRTSAAG